jgi:hypothetical protein
MSIFLKRNSPKTQPSSMSYRGHSRREYQGNYYCTIQPVRDSRYYREERHDTHGHQQGGGDRYYDNRREFARNVDSYLNNKFNRRICGFSKPMAATWENINSLPNKPGVYEIAFWQITKAGGKRCQTVVYVGETGDLKERLLDHFFKVGRIDSKGRYRDPSNIGKELQGLLDEGFVMFFEVIELETKHEAEVVEKDLLRKYDYAFNLKDNRKVVRRPVFDRK